jgi:hypothetical protein
VSRLIAQESLLSRSRWRKGSKKPRKNLLLWFVNLSRVSSPRFVCILFVALLSEKIIVAKPAEKEATEHGKVIRKAH